MRVVVDIGSNSVKFSAARGDAELVGKGSWVTRLGAGSKQRLLLPESVAQTAAALREIRARVSELEKTEGPAEFRVVATSAVRDASNPEAVASLVQNLLGVSLRVLSGDEEARLSFAGALEASRQGWNTEESLFIDVGGASTEVGMAVPEFHAHSFQAGAVRCHEGLGLREDPVSDARWGSARAGMESFFPASVWDPLFSSFGARPRAAVAVGGTLVLAAKLLLEEGSERVENLDAGLKLSRVAFERLNERLRKLRVAERLQLPYMVAGRADIVCAGLLCLTHVMERARLAEVLVTDWGLRHGILRSWDRPSAPRT